MLTAKATTMPFLALAAFVTTCSASPVSKQTAPAGDAAKLELALYLEDVTAIAHGADLELLRTGDACRPSLSQPLARAPVHSTRQLPAKLLTATTHLPTHTCCLAGWSAASSSAGSSSSPSASEGAGCSWLCRPACAGLAACILVLLLLVLQSQEG